MNVLVPALVAEAFPESRIVAFSTGCVYPFVPVSSGGSTEDCRADAAGRVRRELRRARADASLVLSERHGRRGGWSG